MAYPVHPSRIWGVVPWALLALAAGCGSVATDGAGPGTATLALAPEFPEQFVTGSLNLTIDRVRVRVVRPPSDWIVDTSAVFPAHAQSITLRVSMPLKSRQELLGVVLELWAGPLLIFSGARNLEVTEGSQLGEPPRIPMTYRGPGAEARRITIFPRDTVLRPGERFSFAIAADNGEGVPVGDVYASWSLTGGGATVSTSGELTAPAGRGSVMLRAVAATGARDSTRIWFAPAPTLVSAITGEGQTGVVGSALPAPLVARVLAGDGLGVPGIPVQFYSTVPGAEFATPVVITDGEGYARTLATLGTRSGGQGLTAFVAGLGSAHFTVFGTVGPPSQIQIVRGNEQQTAPGVQVAVPLEVSIRDFHGNRVGGALVRWSVVQGGGQLGLNESTTDASGTALSAYTMGPLAETNVVRATLESTGNSVLFILRTP